MGEAAVGRVEFFARPDISRAARMSGLLRRPDLRRTMRLRRRATALSGLRAFDTTSLGGRSPEPPPFCDKKSGGLAGAPPAEREVGLASAGRRFFVRCWQRTGRTARAEV